jgi:hypothetical protein
LIKNMQKLGNPMAGHYGAPVAERYDRDLTDIFALQDEITEAVTTAIAPAIADAEQQRAMRKPPGNLDAWAAYQRGLWSLRWAGSGLVGVARTARASFCHGANMA